LAVSRNALLQKKKEKLAKENSVLISSAIYFIYTIFLFLFFFYFSLYFNIFLKLLSTLDMLPSTLDILHWTLDSRQLDTLALRYAKKLLIPGLLVQQGSNSSFRRCEREMTSLFVFVT